MMASIYALFAFLAGMGLPLQVGLNTMVARASTPLWSSAVSFLIGAVGMFAVVFASRQPWPTTLSLGQVPAYAWCAGLLGAFYVTTTIFAAPKIGAAALVGFVIAGQLIASITFDHYGFAGFPQHSINIGRIAGAICLIIGVVLIKKF